MEPKVEQPSSNDSGEDNMSQQDSSCIQTASVAEDTYKCDWENCDKIFDTLLELDNHASTAHSTKDPPYICQWKTCRRRGNPFEHFFSFVNHMRTHISKATHPCPVPCCNKRYRTFDSLRNHMVIHTAPKPYICFIEGCFHAFATVAERTKHIFRVHSNLKRFLCPMLDCTRRYSDPSSLRKHLKTLHGESAYAVFRELKSSVRVWEKSFRIRNDIHGAAHIVGVNGEIIDFDEIVKHIVDMTNTDLQHRPNLGDLEESHEHSDENASDPDHSPSARCYGTPAFHPCFLYPSMSSYWLYPRSDGTADMKLIVPPSPYGAEAVILPAVCVEQPQKSQSDSDISVPGSSQLGSSSQSAQFCHPFIQKVDLSIPESNENVNSHNAHQRVNQMNIKSPHEVH